MFRRGLAVLLCSAMLAGSLPETSFAAEISETTETAAETETAEAEAEDQADDASTESNEDAQASQTAVPETQTMSGTETTEAATETTEAATETTEVTTTETAETSTTEGTADASTETAAQEEETTDAATEPAATETEETTNPATEEASTEVVTETEEETTTEEITSEVMTEEVENAEEQSSTEAADTLGNEDVKVSNLKVTYNSISFDYKVINSDVESIYVKDSEGTHYANDLYYGSDSVTINGLNPSTEYTVLFTSYYEIDKYYEFTRTTAECPYDVIYDIKATKANEITITADITAKEGAGEYKLPDAFDLNWKYFDADGNLLCKSERYDYSSVGKLPAKITSVINGYKGKDLFENTDYTLEVWISEEPDYEFEGSTQYAKKSEKVTTPASGISDVSIAFTPDESDPSYANYVVTTDSTVNAEGYISYRLKGSAEWSTDTFEISNGNSQASSLYLSLGSTYEYVVNVGGFRKTSEYTHGEAKLKWEVSYDVGALDAVAVIKLDESTKTKDAVYRISGSYRWNDSIDGWMDLSLRKEDNDTYVAYDLYPDTNYEIVFTIREDLPNGRQNTYTVLETVKTKECAVTTTNVTTGIDSVKFTAVLAPSVTTKYSRNVYVEPYVKNQDGKYTRLSGEDIVLSPYEDEDRQCRISGLESNKVYDVTFGRKRYDPYGNPETFYKYATTTFKTPADDRRITLDAPEIGVSSFKVNGTFTGSTFPYDDSCYVVMMYREQGTSNWKYAAYTDIYPEYDYDDDGEEQIVETKETFSFSTAGITLEPGKSYEYAVGISDGNSEPKNIDKLKDVKKGTVTLKPEGRKVEISDSVQLLDGVVLKATLLGKYIDEYNTAYMFFREKGKTDAPWVTEEIYFGEDQKDTTCVISSYNGEALKSGTTYEYKLSMSESIRDKEEEFTKLPVSEFTFTPPADDRALTVEKTENRNDVRFTIELTGNKAVRNYVTIFYREKGSESWDSSKKTIYWNRDQVTTTIRLTENTEYEYIIGISNEQVSSPDGLIAASKQTGTCSTKDSRKLGTPDITTGYGYADVKVKVEGLTTNDEAYVRLYTKDTAQQDAGWTSRGSSYVYYRNQYSYNTEATFSISGLEQGKTYDYALILADNGYNNIAPDTEAYKKLAENRKFTGTFSTKKSDYKLEIAQSENSVYGKEILTFKAASDSGYNEKFYEVSYRITPKGQTYAVASGTVVLSNEDYAADVELINLAENTEYNVTATLYAKSAKTDSSQIIRDVVATAEYAFQSKAANAPQEGDLKASQEEFFLNSWDGYYCYGWPYISAPEGVSNEVTWKSDNEAVAFVTEDGTIEGIQPGEATITATSVLNPKATATIKVHVKSYCAAFTNTNPWTPVYGIYTLRNTQSTNVAYVVVSDDGQTARKIEATGVSDDPNIAYWDSERQCVVAKNVGTTWITLEADGYKSELEVAVYTDVPDFDVKLSPTTDSGSDYAYPAIKDETTGMYQIASEQRRGYYRLSVEATPKTQYYDIEDVLTFKVDDKGKDVLTVDDYGYVQGLKKGTATVTVSYDKAKIQALIASFEEQNKDTSELKELAKHTDLDSKTKTITFDVRPVPQNIQGGRAISNVHKKLSDVVLGEGWTWRDPETPLYNLPVNSNRFYYEFEAKYTGTEFYNYEGDVRVYISTITGVDVTGSSNAISTGDGDSMVLTVKPVIYGYDGLMEGTDYQVTPGISAKDASVVSYTEDTAGYKITASKKGKYTLKPEIKIGSDVVAVGSYAFTAVEGKLVDHIEIEPVTDNDYVTVKGNTIYFDSNKNVTEFKLQAKAYNRGAAEKAEENTTTKLTWTITDKTIADVDAKASDREVTVKVKGDGHAVIQVTAADEAKASASYKVEVRDHKPRVEADKVTVNTAYDYKSSEGRALSAMQYGYVSIVPVYGDDIDKVQVASTDFKAFYYSSDDSYKEEYYVIAPAKSDLAKGKYSTDLSVTTSSGFTYTYPLSIAVDNKEPKVTVKFSNNMNLFYLNSQGTLDVTLEKNKNKGTNFTIESLKWSDSANPEGFKVSDKGYSVSKTPNVKRYTVDGSKVKVSGGKLADASVASGTVTIKLAGVINEYKDIPVAIKYSYKKPKLTTADYPSGKSTSTLIPSMRGGSLGTFRIYADKKPVVYSADNTSRYDSYEYCSVFKCGNDKVRVTGTESWSDGYHSMNFSYSGTEDKFDIPLTVDSYYWREALTVTHKVKAVKPTAVLSNAKLVFNTKYNNVAYARVTLKDYPNNTYRISGSDRNYSVITAVDIVAKDKDSHDLLTSNALQLEYASGGYITAKLNASKLGSAVPKGASYVLTPYYYDNATKGTKALNTLPLSITFTDKPITAKASGKGKLDITIRNDEYPDVDGIYESYSAKVNSIAVTAKFANLGSGYYVEEAKLIGEYSKYFSLCRESEDYSSNPTLYIKNNCKERNMLKAGQNYNLSIVYTLSDDAGNQITVTSNVLKVKPIQKAPKITVSGNTRSLYMASPNLYRTCEIWTPYYTTRAEKDYYIIQDAYGSLDTNKDGKADIEVRFSEHDSYDIESGHAVLKIKLTKDGRHSVAATAKGKSYTVPVTVQLLGRDGITKDATISIKVTVKK